MPKAAPKRHSADAATAAHPYKQPQFSFGSPKKPGAVPGQAAGTPGTTTKTASGGAAKMQAPSLRAPDPNSKHKKFNNFPLWTLALVAQWLGCSTVEKNGKTTTQMERLVKAQAWVDRRGQSVEPKQQWKLDQYGAGGQYFNGLLKIYQVYNNTDTPGNTKKLTFRAMFVKEDATLDLEAMENFESFVLSFQWWVYENRLVLPWQWTKGAKNIAKKMKEIAAETKNATFEEIMTDPKWQKYKTKTNEDTGDDYYVDWDKNEIGTVVDGEAPPAGAVVIGNKFFSNRVKKNRQGVKYAEFDMNLDKFTDIVDSSSGESISLTDITEGSVVEVRGVQTLYALNEQQIVGGVPKLPMGRQPVLKVIYKNPEGRKIQPDKSSAQGAGSSGSSYDNSDRAAYDRQQSSQLASRFAANMAAKMAAGGN